MKRIYFDHNAMSPIRPQALTAMMKILAQVGNPSSVHWYGRKAHHGLEEARETIAQLFKVTASRCLFTASCTEANNMVLRGSGCQQIAISATEHESVKAVVSSAHVIPVDQQGVIDLNYLEQFLKKQLAKTLVSVMMANSETGVIQPIDDIAALCQRFNALLHTDATQAIGRIPLTNQKIDFLTFSSHKIGGPVGCGAIITGSGEEIAPLIKGGGQERGRRAGTENVAAVTGFAVAASQAFAEQAELYIRLKQWRDEIEEYLLQSNTEILIHGKGADRIPNTSCFSMPHITGMQQLIRLDLAGIAVSSGSACSSGKVKESAVLKAMGVPAAHVGGALRLSFGWDTTHREVSDFISVWEGLYPRI
ncbi:MAG TPA: cysteine desulfurase family protein [Alphaproteobacteria bacterium]|nr:cysteine desulfurase family protein [Alphaproteobacteria bacterium]